MDNKRLDGCWLISSHLMARALFLIFFSLAMLRFASKLPSEVVNPLPTAFKHAQNILEKLKSELAEKNTLDSKVTIEMMDPKNHSHYYNGPFEEIDYTKDIYRKLHWNRFKRFVEPQTIKTAKELKVIGDCLPEVENMDVFLQVNYDEKNWIGAYGHYIRPEDVYFIFKVDASFPKYCHKYADR